ncbi:MAG: LssY C-terminal domain-containing protein, partial [Gammaproteobacteria bacterium]|nr:LssY C-terminal domain-containing protein [Gammaproteobacteria bacterium]
LTSSYFFAILCLSLGILFIFKKNLFSLWYWLAAISLPLVLSPLLSNELARSLQQNINLDVQTLPLIVVVSVIGFLTIIINSGLSYYRQKIIFYFSSTLVLFLILAQLYFSFQVFTQALFGLFIGIIWFNVLGIAYRRHTKESINKKTRNNILIIIVILLFYPGWKTFHHDKLYISSDDYLVMGTNSWLESGWEILPIIREGINQNKNDIFNLQWLGDKQDIVSSLQQLGFTNSLNSIQALSNWFLDDVDIDQLPVLPHIHKGSYETLRFYHYNNKKQELTVIRLWLSKYKLRQDNPLQPLWFGSISSVNVKKQLGISYLVTSQEAINDLKFDNTRLTVYKRLMFDNKENKNRTIFLVM